MDNAEEDVVVIGGGEVVPEEDVDVIGGLDVDPIGNEIARAEDMDVSNVNLQDDNEPINRVPNEVWVLILSQLNQKELVQARTVWKKWREVVDAHFEFTVILHDGKADLDRIYNLRIKDCLVTRLLEDKDIFQYPSLLKRLRWWGPCNPKAFQRVMKKAGSLEQVSLTKYALMQDDLMDRNNFIGFKKVKKLELLGYICKDESKAVMKNAAAIFDYDMPDLEKLTVNFHCDINSINKITRSLMNFLSRHLKMQNLVVTLIPELNHANEATTAMVPLSEEVRESLRSVQLNILRVTTATKDLEVWTNLLSSQTRLQDLRILLNEGGIVAVSNSNYTVGILFDLVKQPLIRNASTLVSVELKDLRLAPNADALDASIFRYASNLKKLVLYRNTEDNRRAYQNPNQPCMSNLKMVPASVEVLEISRFYCRSDELQYLVDVLENLRTIVLTHTGSLTGLGVHGGIVESITKKTDIQTMNLSPVNFYCVEENQKYDAVKAKFQMNDGDHLYYDFERFRNGLPQPRPPKVESTYVARQFPPEPNRFSRRRTLRRMMVRHQREARSCIRSRGDPLRRFAALCEMRSCMLHLDVPDQSEDARHNGLLELLPNQYPCGNRQIQILETLDLHVTAAQRRRVTGHTHPPSRRRRLSHCVDARTEMQE